MAVLSFPILEINYYLRTNGQTRRLDWGPGAAGWQTRGRREEREGWGRGWGRMLVDIALVGVAAVGSGKRSGKGQGQTDADDGGKMRGDEWMSE